MSFQIDLDTQNKEAVCGSLGVADNSADMVAFQKLAQTYGAVVLSDGKGAFFFIAPSGWLFTFEPAK